MASTPSSLMSALDFFGKEDAEVGVEKFKTVAFRALHEQRIDEELCQTKSENERLQKENAALAKELHALQLSFDTNVGDRERVLAFKSKRIEELNIKLKECEAINASLLLTINGGAEGIEHVGSRATMTSLLSSGKPLFHALETCKEQEFRRLFDDKRVQCEQLVQQMQANDVLVQEMRVYQSEKEQVEEQIRQLEARIVAVTAQKDDEVHFLERKLVFEHDRLRKEKHADIRACQEDMETQMRTQLDVATQRTIEENERVQLELRYQSSQLERLVKQVDQLLVENKQIAQAKRIFEDMNASLSKRIKFYEQLFAKMQEKDQLRSKHERESGFYGGRAGDDHNNRRCNDLYGDDSYGDDQDLFEGRDQLNSVTDALETHLQRREFARKQVDAALRYHQTHQQHQLEQLRKPRGPKTASVVERQKGVFMGSAPLVRKKIMLSKAAYSPSSYQRGRKLIDVPTTLDSFIRQHASISPRPRAGNRESFSNSSRGEDGSPAAPLVVLPELLPPQASKPSPPAIVSQDRSDMWKAKTRPESPATARF